MEVRRDTRQEVEGLKQTVASLVTAVLKLTETGALRVGEVDLNRSQGRDLLPKRVLG